MNDVIDISPNYEDLPSSGSAPKRSFGGGIELLMNDNTRPASNPVDKIDIDDLNNLENEINGLVEDAAHMPSNHSSSHSFGGTSPTPSIRFNDTVDTEPMHLNGDDNNLGRATSDTHSDGGAKTWDGYGKFDNIPVDPDAKFNTEPRMSKTEMLKEKIKYLQLLEKLEKKGVELTKKYTMESNLYEMQSEYETLMELKNKQVSIKFQSNMLMSMVNGLEFLNSKFDPFNINIDGWGEQINENLSDYDDIFGELHEKYKNKASVAPELKLVFQLGVSGIMVHMSNSIMKSSIPGTDDILRQNPELMRQFQQAAMSSMSGANPGLSGFVNGVMNQQDTMNPFTHGPAAPIPPQTARNEFVQQSRGGNNAASMGRSAFADDGISVKENAANKFNEPPQAAQKSGRRPDMKGPSDISGILSGLKTKTININQGTDGAETNNNSMISVDELKSLQQDANVPKRSRRRKSDKNTVSLDI